MEIRIDGTGSKYIGWEQPGGGFRRAVIRQRRGYQNDWAGTGRYLLVICCDDSGRPTGNATDFPIYNGLSDEKILLTFVRGVNAITGCTPMPERT